MSLNNDSALSNTFFTPKKAPAQNLHGRKSSLPAMYATVSTLDVPKSTKTPRQDYKPYLEKVSQYTGYKNMGAYDL